MAGFLQTYAGMYLSQSLCHSVVAAALADSALVAWHITDPVVRQRFRLIVIVAPVLSFPAYQLMNPERGSIYFRLEALFDVTRWFYLDVFGLFTLWTAALVVMGLTAFVFLVQELVPIIATTVDMLRGGAGEEEDDGEPLTGQDKLDRATEGLPFGRAALTVFEEEEMALFSSTGRNPEVFVSTGIIMELSEPELRAAVAHELAHVQRSRTPFLPLAYLLRVLMFFNPVALIEFRKVAQEEENVCDDMSCRMTGDCEALARAIEHMRPDTDDLEVSIPDRASQIEMRGHDMLLNRRINRMREGAQAGEPGGGWFQFAATLALVLVINYFVV